MAITTLGSKAVGDIVKIKENGTAVNYIIVHKGLPSSMYDSSCNGVWVLRERSIAERAWDGTSTSYSNEYKYSDIKIWLNGTFLNTIDAEVRAEIKTVKIPFHNGKGNTGSVASGSSGLSCDVFLLGGYEVGFTAADREDYFPEDGARLSYFLNGSSDDSALNKRICYDKYGKVWSWWLRSSTIGGPQGACIVGSTGSYATCGVSYTNFVRPAFILPTTLKVDTSGNIVFNTAPTISGSSSSGSNLGEKSAPFSFTYSVRDADGDTVTVKEYLDNVLQRSYTASLGSTYTFQATYNSSTFRTILNGSHTIKVTATDSAGNSSSSYTVYFNKQVKTATISLSSPLPADDLIKAAVVTVTGSIPEDATLKVLVTNNAKDTSPVWEDMSRDVKQSVNHIFANKTAVNGFAFNFKVTVTRGVSGTQGYISNIGGAFE